MFENVWTKSQAVWEPGWTMTMGWMLQIQFAQKLQKLGMLLHYSLTDRVTFKYIIHMYKVICVGSQAFRKKIVSPHFL